MNRNPPVWEKSYKEGFKVCWLNICSLQAKIDDIRTDPILHYGDVIIFGETWLNAETESEDPALQLNGYKLHLNSVGRGKGLAVYYKEKEIESIYDVTKENLQITCLNLQNLLVVCLYKSSSDITLATELQYIIPPGIPCLIMGDFNICLSRSSQHEVFTMLRSMGFQVQVSEATHFAGGHLDQIWVRNLTEDHKSQLYSPYYTSKDHDALLFTLYDPSTESGMFSI